MKVPVYINFGCNDNGSIYDYHVYENEFDCIIGLLLISNCDDVDDDIHDQYCSKCVGENKPDDEILDYTSKEDIKCEYIGMKYMKMKELLDSKQVTDLLNIDPNYNNCYGGTIRKHVIEYDPVE